MLINVSGNQSKQWNKHFACYISNGLLTREALMEEFHVRFVAASPTATPLEIMQGVRSSMERAFNNPVVAYDALNVEEALLRPFPLLYAGDNPMQAELSSGAGLNSNFFCRTCHVGGSQEHKRSDVGFGSIFESSTMRTSSETREKVFEQLVTALEPNVATKLTEAVRDSGVKDGVAQPIIDHIVKLGQQLRKSSSPEQVAHSPEEVQAILTKELRKAHGRGQTYNPLLDVEGVDIHKDTPTEILHTILLGIVKYFWGQTVFFLEKAKQFHIFQICLNSIASDGLNIPAIPADYICQYKGALIGKHFKTLSQIMAFTIYDLVPQNVLDAWLLISRLTVMLWHTEIDDMNVYLAKLQQCIDDILDVTALCSPSILISKPKFHFLVHLPFYIRRFGPAILYSTERYESYNAVFRAASMHSNRMAPSRDIAGTFAGMDSVKHISTGGWWKDSLTGKWVCAGASVMAYVNEHSEHCKLLGLRVPTGQSPGHVVFLRAKATHQKMATPVVLKWEDSMAHSAGLQLSTVLNDLSHESSHIPDANLQFYSGKTIVAENRDRINSGQFAIICRPSDGKLIFGKVLEILVVPSSPDTAVMDPLVYVVVQLFEIGERPHERLDMPVLRLTSERIVMRPVQLVCGINLQHDCHHGQCTTDSYRSHFVERELSDTLTRNIISHSDELTYILNAGSLHNYRAIYEALPVHLRSSSFKVDNSLALRQRAAALVRERKKQQTEEHHELLATKVAEHAGVSNAQDANTSQPKDLLQTDGDILDALGSFLGETEPDKADPLPQTETDLSSCPVFDSGAPRAHKTRAITGLASCSNDVLKELCCEHKLLRKGKKEELINRLEAFYADSTLLPPTSERLTGLHRQIQARNVLAKSAKSIGKRKRAEDLNVSSDGLARALVEGEVSGLKSAGGGLSKRRKGAVDDVLRQSNIHELHKLLMGEN
ncbi:hypothetical protein HETIRDRAFT_320848 [Heterobasidion irregulare TC 32-1]|uniref:SAP domain-containing protein n=1 Tax=Heterobasidion irregulare (strain TC 32-1) TaxID=747525 RepID=W4K591_HETIT|nr:uncharacterized protein HETIRDRAFT_320848 [Heterobasidion irregulare TC 32-1]ETW80535.1 hypothetical protein HETIRDRAFT_320848 [Heterobasidion irregulare TC 32-1]